MTDSKQPGFWQTLPGVLTALTGVITAVAGLMVAFNQLHAGSARAPESGQAPAAVQAPAAAQTPAAVQASAAAQTGAAAQTAASRPAPASPSSTARPGETLPALGPPAVGPLTVGPPGEVRFKGGSLVYSVLAAKLEPFNQDTRLLNISLRINNDMKSFDRNYYSELRALADGLPQAPVDAPFEQIEAHSVKDITYTFRLPAGLRTLTLRITRDEEAGEIPLHLQ